MTPERRAEIVRLYVENNWSYKTVSRHLNLSTNTVRAVLTDEGVMRSRADYGDIPDRIQASMAGVPLEEFKWRSKRGLRYCTPCSREEGEAVWHPVSAMRKDRNRRGGVTGTCLEQRRRSQARCLDKHTGCRVRWGKHQHRHCPEPIRELEDGTVLPCDQPMIPDADRCATCEAVRLLQERIADLEYELRMRTGRRLPSMVDDPRGDIAEAI